EGIVVAPIESVIAGNDLSHFLAGDIVLVAHARTVVEERNRILLLVPPQRKELVHHGVGKEDAVVGGVVIAMAHPLYHSHNFEANVIQHDRAADSSSAAGKQVLHHLVADHAHEPFLAVIGVIQPAATIERQIPNRVEMRRNTHDLAVGVSELADLANILPS